MGIIFQLLLTFLASTFPGNGEEEKFFEPCPPIHETTITGDFVFHHPPRKGDLTLTHLYVLSDLSQSIVRVDLESGFAEHHFKLDEVWMELAYEMIIKRLDPQAIPFHEAKGMDGFYEGFRLLDFSVDEPGSLNHIVFQLNYPKHGMYEHPSYGVLPAQLWSSQKFIGVWKSGGSIDFSIYPILTEELEIFINPQLGRSFWNGSQLVLGVVQDSSAQDLVAWVSFVKRGQDFVPDFQYRMKPAVFTHQGGRSLSKVWPTDGDCFGVGNTLFAIEGRDVKVIIRREENVAACGLQSEQVRWLCLGDPYEGLDGVRAFQLLAYGDDGEQIESTSYSIMEYSSPFVRAEACALVYRHHKDWKLKLMWACHP